MNTILIIEDQEDVNHMLAESLTAAGYRVQSAYTGADGLREIHNGLYDLVLLDIMLTYKSGDEILKDMRQFSDAPVIIISAKDLVGTKIGLLKLGADDYITKPFDLGEVVARVESNLRRSRRDQSGSRMLRHKDLLLDESAKLVSAGGTEIELTAKEYMYVTGCNACFKIF